MEELHLPEFGEGRVGAGGTGSQESPGGKHASLAGCLCVCIILLQLGSFARSRSQRRVVMGCYLASATFLGRCLGRRASMWQSPVCSAPSARDVPVAWIPHLLGGCWPCPKLCVTTPTPLGMAIRNPDLKSSLNHLLQDCPGCLQMQ